MSDLPVLPLPKSFDTILIANRGEIACRVIRTCRKLGLRSVAVYSDADRDSEHVRLADAGYHIGGSRPAESYLLGDRIIAAALQSGAQAIHPGFGFLSENADFADAVEQAGLVFIGPKSQSMRKMGSKAGAKELMHAAGVPIVPGYQGAEQDSTFLSQEAERIGFPLMIKAAHGGGGKGMRIVRKLSEFAAALESCQREAKSAFGRDRVLLERYIETPRHIEIQIFGDAHGQVFHLNERECSVQRRYQKILEESPSPIMTPALRHAMGAAAIQAGEAIDYQGAGTVEFIVGADGQFYFMEINTRLQVEHPVTELCLGLDLVEQQIRVAEGHKLPWQQHALLSQGHAIEVRLYAEDPEAGFLPASGPLLALKFPEHGARIDSGVREGNHVSVFYDPMIAKLIVHAPDRAQAIASLRAALKQTCIYGIKSNIDFLEVLTAHPDFVAARIDTGYLDRALESLYQPATELPIAVLAAACIAQRHWQQHTQAKLAPDSDPYSPWNTLDDWRTAGDVLNSGAEHYFNYRGDRHSARLSAQAGAVSSRFALSAAGTNCHLTELRLEHSPELLSLTGKLAISGGSGEAALQLQIRPLFDQALLVALEVHDGQRRYLLQLASATSAQAGSSKQSDQVRAPMPGRIVAIKCKLGERVEAGAELLVMEAMKMELSLKAPRSGMVLELRATEGEFVEAETLLVKLGEVG